MLWIFECVRLLLWLSYTISYNAKLSHYPLQPGQPPCNEYSPYFCL